MDRNKRPALTSPWKIGFLVSLLLVIVSIGVGWMITRTFGVNWSWIRSDGGSWAFDQNAFMKEMLPLVVIVPVLSLLAYFVITGAVRRYRLYLDSGLDYKHLLQSIKKIEDLNEKSVNKLNNYPELKDFLLKIKNRVKDRDQTISEKEAALKKLNKKISVVDEFKAETGVLLGAINNAADDGLKEELALSIPELKQLEQAVRRHFAADTQSGSGANSSFSMTSGIDIASLKKEFVDIADMLKLMMAGITAEMEACQSSAREIEEYSNRLAAAGPVGESANGQNNTAGMLELIDRLDATSSLLTVLGDETKGAAINTALHAGTGEAGAKDLVKLADDVRDVASKFGGLSAQYQEIARQLRTCVRSDQHDAGAANAGETVEIVSSRMMYWVERTAILAEKLKAFETRLLDSTSGFESKLATEQGEDNYQDIGDLSIENNETGFTDNDVINNEQDVKFEQQKTDEPALETVPAASPVEGLETEDVSPAGQPAVDAAAEQDKNLFEEIGARENENAFDPVPVNKTFEPAPVDHTDSPAGEEKPDVQDNADGMYKEIDNTAHTAGVEAELPAHEPTPEPAPETPVTPVQRQNGIGETPISEIVTPVELETNRAEVSPSPPVQDQIQSTPAEAVAEPAETAVRDEEPAQEEEKIYDLYELGAVDYEPTIHQNA